jgi:hypothetical protein
LAARDRGHAATRTSTEASPGQLTSTTGLATGARWPAQSVVRPAG